MELELNGIIEFKSYSMVMVALHQQIVSYSCHDVTIFFCDKIHLTATRDKKKKLNRNQIYFNCECQAFFMNKRTWKKNYSHPIYILIWFFRSMSERELPSIHPTLLFTIYLFFMFRLPL